MRVREWPVRKDDMSVEKRSEEIELVIVSNRSAIDFVWHSSTWQAQPATSALAIMLEPLVRRVRSTWYSCVAEPDDAVEQRSLLYHLASKRIKSLMQVVPVPIAATTYEAYYGQISNEVLWMLQHGIEEPDNYANLASSRYHAWTEGYVQVNLEIASAIADSTTSPRAFLVHDYHLYLLPSLLRQAFPGIPILHFTHIPFPKPEILRWLPEIWRSAILCGLLGADVVGLQTEADAENFMQCCHDFLGKNIDATSKVIWLPGNRHIQVRAYPASVNPQEVNSVLQSDDARSAEKRFTDNHIRQTIVRVDRLDPAKNQVTGFLAFSRLLEQHPEFRGQVRFLAFLVPSRTNLSAYQAYRDKVNRVVEEINARYAREGEPAPIQVFYENNRVQALVAMQHSDVMFANSLADGMNLVVKEWAIVSTRPGVLVLANTVGVAQEAREAALLVSPQDVEGTAEALAHALVMPDAERHIRLGLIRTRVRSWTATDWLTAQLDDLGLKSVSAQLK